MVIATGISSVTVQLLTIREFLAQFKGNEIVIALILFSWLFLGGLGTFGARVFAQKKKILSPSVFALGIYSCFILALPVIQIVAIRWLRDLIFIHGADTGFYSIFAYIFFTIMPYALLVGFVLPFSLFVIRDGIADYPGARIYLADNAGDLAGGALFSFILVFFLTPLKALFAASIPLSIAVCFLYPLNPRKRFIITLFAVIILGINGVAAFYEMNLLDPETGRQIHYEESRYSRLEVVEDQGQFTLFSDGVPTMSSINRTLAEEAIHYPLAQAIKTQHILLVSSVSEMMTEIEKYNLRTIDYVDIDPAAARLKFTYDLLKKVPGLSVIHQDARIFLSGTTKTYDAILVNLPEPETFQINRFFTSEFFRMAKSRLSPGGIFSFAVKGFDNYLTNERREQVSMLYHTAHSFFPHILLIPGQRIFFLCSDIPLKTDIPNLLNQKGVSTIYIKHFFHGDLTRERIDRLNNMILPQSRINSDENPALMKLMFLQWFKKHGDRPVWFIAGIGLFTLLYLLYIKKESYLLFTTGTLVMGAEVLVIFAFQIYFGYIYFQVGVIVTLFLAGLLPGAYAARMAKGNGKSYAMVADGLLIGTMILFYLAVSSHGDRLPVLFFQASGFIISFLCGFQFPLILDLGGDDNRAAFQSFSADLVGAGFGALVTSLVLIPFMGLGPAALLLAALKMTSLVIMGFCHESR